MNQCAAEQMELRLAIAALSSLTLADKEICLSPVEMCASCKTN